MCLCAHNTKPLSSSKDLVVIKALVKDADGNYATPVRKADVKLGETLKAEGDLPGLPSDYSDNVVEGGVIHAYIDFHQLPISKRLRNYSAGMAPILDDESAERVFTKAVIPAGTPFYIDTYMDEIAAREMRIVGEIDGCEGLAEEIEATMEEVRSLLMESPWMQNEDGVRVGDVLLSDRKTFVRPESIQKRMEIIGIVAFIRPDGTPQAITLQEEKRRWDERLYEGLFYGANFTKGVHDDFNGYGHTKEFAKSGKRNHAYNHAFNYCLGYETEGTKPGDWYLPSSGEMLQTGRNTWFINETVARINDRKGCKTARLISGRTLFYWTSTVKGTDFFGVAGLNIGAFSPWITGNVKPFLHLEY